MHVLLVTNDKSGSAGDADPRQMLLDRGCGLVETDVQTASRWTETLPASRLRSVERVIVAGGDGSVGCAATLALELDVPLGVIPMGTANDFARAVDLPDDIEQATLLAATGDTTRPIDVGRVDGHPFVNVASFGLAPRAARSASRLKSLLGPLAYPIGALVAVLRSRPVHMVVTVDGDRVFEGACWQAIVASTGAFGGWADVGRALAGDRELDLVVVAGGRGAHRLALDATALGRGALTERPGVLHVRGREITVEMRSDRYLVVDGEHLRGRGRAITSRIDPRQLQLVVGR